MYICLYLINITISYSSLIYEPNSSIASTVKIVNNRIWTKVDKSVDHIMILNITKYFNNK